ncbi:MAG: non-ribosomal peptide synthetase, partial [Acidobacteria bacterium]
VVERRARNGEPQLVAYIVPRGGPVPSISGLRASLRQSLPDYMIPSAFVVLDALPLTPSGKVDRPALPKPTLTSSAGSREVMPPRNLLELELIRLWRRLFQREDIDRQDNFFALGGHSLLAERLAAEIKNRFGIELPRAALFQSPTIESLARRMTEESWAPAIPAPPVSRLNRCFLK